LLYVKLHIGNICIDLFQFQLRNLENKNFYEGMIIGINACLLALANLQGCNYL